MRPLTSPMFAVDSKSDVTGDRLCSSITPEVGSPGSAGAEVRTKEETWSRACVWDQQTWHLLPRRPCRWTRPCQLRGCEEHQRTECRYEERSAQLVVREDIIRVVRHPRVNEVFHVELSRALVALCRRFSGRLIPHFRRYCVCILTSGERATSTGIGSSAASGCERATSSWGRSGAHGAQRMVTTVS
jgi:hypothetical protein